MGNRLLLCGHGLHDLLGRVQRHRETPLRELPWGVSWGPPLPIQPRRPKSSFTPTNLKNQSIHTLHVWKFVGVNALLCTKTLATSAGTAVSAQAGSPYVSGRVQVHSLSLAPPEEIPQNVKSPAYASLPLWRPKNPCSGPTRGWSRPRSRRLTHVRK